MEGVYFSELLAAPSLDSMSYFVGYHQNMDGTYTDYSFTPAQLISLVLASASKMLTVPTAGNTITDSWLTGKTVQEITADNQTYLAGVNFTQTANTITGLNISFSAGQVVRLKQ